MRRTPLALSSGGLARLAALTLLVVACSPDTRSPPSQPDAGGPDAGQPPVGAPELLATLANGQPGDLALTSDRVFVSDSAGNIVESSKTPGHAPVVRSAGCASPWGVAVAPDQSDVYWTCATWPDNGTVMRSAIGSGSAWSPQTLATGLDRPTDIVADAAGVIFFNHTRSASWTTEVVKIPLAGGSRIFTIGGQSYPSGLSIRAGEIFWGGNNTVKRADAATGATSTVVPPEVYPQGVCSDGVFVYYTAFPGVSPGSVTKVPIGGGAPSKLADAEQPWAIAVDGDWVYYSDRGTAQVLAVPISGGAAPVVVATGQTDPIQIAVDGTGVYWVNFGGKTLMRAAK